MTTHPPTSDDGGPSGPSRRVCAYTRVSTDRQAEEGHGLDVQADAIAQLCKAEGWDLVATYRDEGESGSNGLDTRRGLFDALEALRAHKATALVVYRLDRLARDLAMQEQLLAEVGRMGAEVFSCSPTERGALTDDPDDPSRAMIRQILGAVNQYERSMIRLRMRQGWARKVTAGGFGGGQVPLGFKTVGHELVSDPEEAATLERIRELRADELSLRQMAATLTQEGHRPKRSATWHPQSLALVLKRLETTPQEGQEGPISADE